MMFFCDKVLAEEDDKGEGREVEQGGTCPDREGEDINSQFTMVRLV